MSNTTNPSYTIEVSEQEIFSENPFSSNLLSFFSTCRWFSSHNTPHQTSDFHSWDDAQKGIEKNLIQCVIYVYDHGSKSFSLSNNGCPFNDEWYAYPMGIAYITEQNAKEYFRKIHNIKSIRGEANKAKYQEFINIQLIDYIVDAKNGLDSWVNGGSETVYNIIDEDGEKVERFYCQEDANEFLKNNSK